MNYMPRMVTNKREIRTKFRLDPSGLLFLSVSEPGALLTFKVESDTLQEEMSASLEGLFAANGEAVEAVELFKVEADELVWLATSQAFERELQVA